MPSQHGLEQLTDLESTAAPQEAPGQAAFAHVVMENSAHVAVESNSIPIEHVGDQDRIVEGSAVAPSERAR
jgi:hypothetical protein